MSQIDNTLDFRRFFRAARRFWWLYLIAFAVLMGGAVTYSLCRMPAYDTTATMLIEDSSDPTPSGLGMATMLGRSFSIGGFGSSSVNNELYVIDSHDVVVATAKALGLNRTYILKDGLKKELLYPDSPVTVEASQEYFDTLTVGYNIQIKIFKDGKADIEFTRGRFFPKTLVKAENVTFPYVSTNPEYPVTIARTDYFQNGKEYNILAVVNSYEGAAAAINEKVVTEEPDKLSDAIRLTYSGPNKAYNKALLNGLLEQYNLKRIDRRRETAKREVEFLNERIAQQISDLNSSEEKMEEYMKNNNITSIEEEVKLLVEKSLSNESALRGLRTSQEYYREVLNTLRHPKTPDDLIPIQSANSSPMIADYNALVLERKSLRRSATPDNSALKLLDSSISDLRTTIERSTENILAERELQIKAIQKEENATTGRLNRMPAYERQFFNLTRDKELQNQLYLFLVEKRENAMLKYDSNSTLGFVVEEAYCSIKPSPKKSFIACGLGLVMSLLLPSFLVLLWTLWKQEVEEPMDLNFDGLESRTIMVDSPANAKALRGVRQLISKTPSRKEIYVLNLASDHNLPQQLADSFRNVETRVEVMNGNDTDNDTLMTASFSKRVKESLQNNSFVIIPIPDSEGTGNIINLLTSPASTLLIAVNQGKQSRNYFKNFIKTGIVPAQTIVAIIH